MNKIISFFTLALLLCYSSVSNAQVTTYTYSQSVGTYNEITGDTVVAIATTSLGDTTSMDNMIYTNNALPFPFFFNNLPYNNVVISSNGFITFGNTLPSTTNYGSISNSSGYAGTISVFSANLIGNRGVQATKIIGSNVLTDIPSNQFVGIAVGNVITGIGIPAGTTITALDAGSGTITISQVCTENNIGPCLIATGSLVRGTTGAVGSRVHTIQFKNVRNYGSTANSNWMNFQIKLYETSNKIELVYGVCIASAFTSGQVGLRGTSNSDYNNLRNATAGWTTTQAGTSSANTLTMSSTITPNTGTTLTWTAPSLPDCQINIANLNPSGVITPGCVNLNAAPKVNITNAGSMNQSSISVRYQVVSEGYDETVSGLSLTSGANMDVNFPNTLLISSSSLGTKAVTIKVNSTCNSGSDEYILNTNYTVENPNFGGPVAGYYWSNSTPDASCAPDQPIFSWEDTTGSTSLIVNGANASAGLLTGSVNDGYFALGNVLPSGNKFKYMGVDYDSFYVGTNGMIAFSKANNTTAELNTTVPKVIPSTNSPRPAIFPLWLNLDYTDTDVPVNRLSYKVIGDKIIITYDKAPIILATSLDYVSFQIILETQFAPTTDCIIISQYNSATTGSGFLSKYNAGTLGIHTVGIQNAAGDMGIQYRRANPVTGGPFFGSDLALAFGTNDAVLPVEFASFTSIVNGNDVTLSWSTASESNNSGYDIERSTSNSSWTGVGSVSGNGTSATLSNYSFTDRNLSSGSYSYRLKQIDFNGNYEYFNLSNNVSIGIPERYDLSQNYPNPFNPATNINFDIPIDGKVSLKIFDMTGREVATLVNEVKTAGYYSLKFNASSLSSGIYFYSLKSGNFSITKKMMLIK
ncbi:MAG TPA: T9SS type A sorting domain-containing protein [Ignavibacteria bacterium]|nr:T9SS type A sorting domain-containing protein [Ignavibacteria bacterium]